MSEDRTNVTPWTKAIREILEDDQWHSVTELIEAAVAVIPDERAEQEMQKKNTAKLSDERRLEIGKRNVALQSLTGIKRFHWAKPELRDGVKGFRKISVLLHSPGAMAEAVEELIAKVADLELQVEALQSFRDHVERASLEGAGEKYYVAASSSAVPS